MKRNILTVILLCLCTLIFAQEEYSNIRKGNRQYADSSFVEAETNYRKAIDKNNKSVESHYNLGNALFRQNKYAEAIEEFQAAAAYSDKENKLQRGRIYHNLGNACLFGQQIDKAIDAYKEALRNNPDDDETRYNLIKAMQIQKEQQEQQQQNQNQQQDQQNQNQDQQQQDQQQDQQEAQEQPTEEQNEGQMTKEQAEQLLKALEQDEKDTQEKAKEAQLLQPQSRRIEKDW